MIKKLSSTFLAFCLFASTQVTANEWFKVEVIIFANKDDSVLNDESWPDINEIPARNAVYLKAADADSTENIGAYRRLPGRLLSLHGERQRLAGSGKYKILSHTGWMQPVAKTQNPKAVRISAGQMLDNGMYELDGYLAVGRGRYLHFRPDLYYSRALPGYESAAPTPAPTNSASAATNAYQLPAIPDVLTVNLNQARRMRSKELHYIDHPLLGILVEIKPL